MKMTPCCVVFTVAVPVRTNAVALGVETFVIVVLPAPTEIVRDHVVVPIKSWLKRINATSAVGSNMIDHITIS